MDPDDPEVLHWRSLLRRRPREVERPGPGEESVWDYPRPPRVEPVALRVRVEFAGVLVADTRAALRVLETASPPVYYVPRADVQAAMLERSEWSTLCEWKGLARYWSLRAGERIAPDAVWDYPEPFPGFAALAGALAFFPGRVDACWLGNERVRPQPGGYYGGWISARIRGPFKGEPGSEGW